MGNQILKYGLVYINKLDVRPDFKNTKPPICFPMFAA
jgi:hypothetical protein